MRSVNPCDPPSDSRACRVPLPVVADRSGDSEARVTQRGLLEALLRANPYQPAVGYWRSIELSFVLERGFPSGFGLDLGCGDGKLMRILMDASQTSAQLVGVDIDPLETRDAAKSGAYLRVHTAPAASVPEPDATFDFVFSNSVLEHIEAIDPVIQAVARLLRPGGTFVFTVPSDNLHGCLRGPLLPWSNREQYLRDLDRRSAHVRYWGAAEWSHCLHQHGLHVVAAAEYLSLTQVHRWENLSRFTGGLLVKLSGGRRHPIEIQRALGVRRRHVEIPKWLARPLATVISSRVPPNSSGPFGCILIEAHKQPPEH